MTDDHAQHISRIESAIARIERALASRATPRTDADYAHLAARHETLRAEVADALIDLGSLGGIMEPKS
jgi:hypothetical protein